jgi:hypothetical protein
MKKLLSILFLLLCVTGTEGGSVITATITVTNTPADGDTITVNGSVKTWKTTVALSSLQILIGANDGANATNLFNHNARWPYTTLTLTRSGTNAVRLRGIVDQALTATVAGTWGVVTYSTNTTDEATVVRVPGSSGATQSTVTNVFSLLATDLGTYSTNRIPVSVTVLQNYADLTTSQTLSNKLIFGGTSTNSQFGMLNAWITNAYIYGALNITNTEPSIYIYDTDAPADEKNTLITTYGGDFKIETVNDAASGAAVIMQVSRTGYAVDEIYFGGDVEIATDLVVTELLTAGLITNTPIQGSTLTLNTYSGTIGSLTNGTIVGSTLTGVTASGTIGTLSGGVITGAGITNTTSTNFVAKGLTQLSGATAFTRANHTSLANGANAAVDFGSATFIKVKAGPSAAFSIAGIASGADGDFYRIVNTTGQNMTISHDSGTDPTPANRIYTTTGADIATTGNGIVDVWYDSEDSRWWAALISQ